MVLPAIALAAFVACGGDDETTPAPVDGSSSSSTSGSTTSSSGSNGPKPGSSSGDPTETVSCDVPQKQLSCAIPAYFAYDVALTQDASCKTSLYVTGIPTRESPLDYKVRRYVLKTLDPCVWDLDAAFTETAAGDVIAADDAGNVISVGSKVVELLKGTERIKCSGELPSTDREAHYATMARDGSVAYIGMYGNKDGKIANIALAKVTITGDSCAIGKFEPTGDALTGINGLAIDTKGRLHIADTTYSDPRAERVGIYDADGKFVSSYKGLDETSYFSPTSITPCKGGICVDGFGAIVSFDENGIKRGQAELRPTNALASLIRYVGSTRGAFFLVGNRNEEPVALSIEAMVRP